MDYMSKGFIHINAFSDKLGLWKIKSWKYILNSAEKWLIWNVLRDNSCSNWFFFKYENRTEHGWQGCWPATGFFNIFITQLDDTRSYGNTHPISQINMPQMNWGQFWGDLGLLASMFPLLDHSQFFSLTFWFTHYIKVSFWPLSPPLPLLSGSGMKSVSFSLLLLQMAGLLLSKVLAKIPNVPSRK